MPSARWRAFAIPPLASEIVPLLDDPDAERAGPGGHDRGRAGRGRGGAGAARASPEGRAPSGCGGRRWWRWRGWTARRSLAAAAKWRTSADWRERAAAAEGDRRRRRRRRPWFLSDRDPAGRRRRSPGLGRARSKGRMRPWSPRPAGCCSTPMPPCGAWRPTPWRGPPKPDDLTPADRRLPAHRRATPFPMPRSRRSAPSWPSGVPRPRPGPGWTRSSWPRRRGRRTTWSGAGRRRTGPSSRLRWGPSSPDRHRPQRPGLPRPRPPVRARARIPSRGPR